MRQPLRGTSIYLTALFACFLTLSAQTPNPSTGEITVRLTQGLNSALDPKGLSQGVVTKSTNPAVPKGSAVWVGLGSDPIAGGYTTKLLKLIINGQTIPAASSAVSMEPDFLLKLNEKTRAKGQPQDAASGSYVFLPTQMIVKFTLATPPPQQAAIPPPASVLAPPPPRHPDSSVVELPPAAPGYSPLHASRAAHNGCWWVPFASQRFGFELPVERCETAANDNSYAETDAGLSWTYGQSTEEAFSIHKKAPTQTIEAAIKLEFLGGLKPAAKAACIVKKFPDTIGPYSLYGVSVAGSAKNITCNGLEGDDNVGTTFLYSPAESKTEYIKFTTQDSLVVLPFDLAALHFAPLESETAAIVAAAPATNHQPSGAAPAPKAARGAGPVAPVNRLNIRGISVRMGRGQVLAAANAAGMKILNDSGAELKLADQTASGNPTGGGVSGGGSGLVMYVDFQNDKATRVVISEQGDLSGNVFQDVQKKWGPPAGKDRIGPYWGDLNGIFADYSSNLYGMLGMHVTIYDKASDLVPQKRQAVPM